MSNKKKTKLRNQAIKQGKQHYSSVRFNESVILTLENQIRKDKSVWMHTMSNWHTVHMVHTGGIALPVIYDKKVGCIESILPATATQTWLKERMVNRHRYTNWRNKWDK